MQNNDYLAVDIMSKKTRYNRFFYPERLNSLKKKFKGLCYFYDLSTKKQKVIQKHPERYKIEMCGNNSARVILFGPIIIGFTLSLILLICCFVATYS
ncbi:hypothetical protein H5158_22830, partial [Pseudoalteromonas sp. SR45-6]|nr:hypothetical protein [Pseudoalteromonas sp. SR45-6]